MSKKILLAIQLSFWALILIVFFLSAYTLFNSNMNSLLDRSVWEYIGNIANILSLIGIVITAFVLFPSNTFNKIQKKLLRENFPKEERVAPELAEYEAIVFTVSRSDIPSWVIKNFAPQAVGLVGSAHSAESVASIDKLAKKQGVRVLSRLLEDADSFHRSSSETQEVIAELKAMGLAKIGVDITGGKTPMSIGAFLAAEEEGVDSVYISAQYDEKGAISSTIHPVLLSVSR